MPDGPLNFREDDSLLPRLAGAIAVSLLAHLAFFSVAQLGSQLHWWDAKPFSMFRKVRFTPEEIARLDAERRKAEEERARQPQPQELVFVQVSQPSDETPETKFYSSQSSRAANPDPSNAQEVRIDGRQTQMIRTEDVPRAAAGAPMPPSPPDMASAPPEPAPPIRIPPPPVPEAVAQAELPVVAEAPPAPVKPPGLGDLVLDPPEVKPAEPPRQLASIRPEAPQPRTRPRTLAEAKIRQDFLSGQKMKQEGGVPRKGPVALDVKGMPFGAYDEALVLAVQSRWFALLDERRFAGGATGKVVVQFNLHADGSVRIVEPQESTVDQLLTSLCVRSVRDPSPYEKWPGDMLRMLGTNVREMKFTFFYN